ncbi:MAG: (Fe-S)-binding protein [Pseudomonadota bacterium]
MYKGNLLDENLSFPALVINQFENTCDGCDLCKKECAFLNNYGNPWTIAKAYKAESDKILAASFECSLCGLCTSVCPKNLDPAAMFLEFRQQAVQKGQGTFSEHEKLLNYEAKGISKQYTLYSLPENSDTIFFPGCSLSGTRPDNTLKTYQYLKTHIDNIGIVLDCCTKPSHDLGRQDFFNKMFLKLKTFLWENGVRTIVVACPSCHQIFNTYGREFTLETVYDIMARKGFEDEHMVSGDVTIHDPCPIRFESRIHDSVRWIIKAMGLNIIDTPHKKEKTFCCGQGGAVECLSPELAQEWTAKRTNEAHPHKTVSYCAGCVNLLSKKSESFHILDLVFDPEKAMAGKAKVSKSPMTYLNRLRLKKELKTESY